MILSFEQIQDIILKNPYKELIIRGRSYAKTLRGHIRGYDRQNLFPQIEGFERPSLRDLRVKYSKTNKDIFSRLSRPIDKVFSAKGGSINYNLPDSQKKKAEILASNVTDGYSVRKWNENFWMPHFLDDPYGVILMEIAPLEEAKRLQAMGVSFAYPTYKSINSIYDYKPQGSGLGYIVLIVSNQEKEKAGLKADDQVYRVIDDAMDYWVIRDSDTTVRIIDGLPNYFTYVPAIRNSDIVDPEREGGVLSLFDDVIELADQFLTKGSIKMTHDFMHGFPKYWEYADNCNSCNGTGYIGADQCQTCKGAGKSVMTKVSDVKLLTPPTKEDVPLTPNVAGYVSPDKSFWEISTADLAMLEDSMNYTIWGASNNIRTQGLSLGPNGNAETATQIMNEIKPQSDRLEMISDMAQLRDKFIIDAIVQVQVQPGYNGCNVFYGRRFMLEGPDEMLEKYGNAKLKGAPVSLLDDILSEYYESQFKSDPVRLAVSLKLMKVEPFVHLSVTQVQTLPIGAQDKAAKLYFGDWLATMNDAMLLTIPVDVLKGSLMEFVKGKEIVVPEPVI